MEKYMLMCRLFWGDVEPVHNLADKIILGPCYEQLVLSKEACTAIAGRVQKYNAIHEKDGWAVLADCVKEG